VLLKKNQTDRKYCHIQPSKVYCYHAYELIYWSIQAHWVSSWTSNTVESLDVNKVVIGLRKMGHFFEIWTWTGCRQAKSSFGHMLFNITKKSNQIFVVLLLTTKNNCSRTINRGINVIKSSFDGFFSLIRVAKKDSFGRNHLFRKCCVLNIPCNWHYMTYETSC